MCQTLTDHHDAIKFLEASYRDWMVYHRDSGGRLTWFARDRRNGQRVAGETWQQLRGNIIRAIQRELTA